MAFFSLRLACDSPLAASQQKRDASRVERSSSRLEDCFSGCFRRLFKRCMPDASCLQRTFLLPLIAFCVPTGFSSAVVNLSIEMTMLCGKRVTSVGLHKFSTYVYTLIFEANLLLDGYFAFSLTLSVLSQRLPRTFPFFTVWRAKARRLF